MARQPGGESFTLNPARAREVMGKFQLANPYTYILKLVQWAVASGATRIDVRVGSRTVALSHDGEVPDVSTLEALIMRTGQRECLHLAMGLTSALRLGATSVVLRGPFGSHTLHGEEQERADYPLPGGVILRGLKYGVSPGSIVTALQMVMRGEVSGESSFLRDHLKLVARPELSLLRFRCVYAPIPVLVNGRPINAPFFGITGTCTYPEEILHVEPSIHKPGNLRGYMLSEDDTGLAAPSWGVSPSYWGTADDSIQPQHSSELIPEAARRPHPSFRVGIYPCLWATAIFYYSSTEGHGTAHREISWVLDGVVLAREAEPSLPPGLIAVVSAQGLSSDLSGFRLIKGQEQDARLKRFLDFFTRCYRRQYGFDP